MKNFLIVNYTNCRGHQTVHHIFVQAEDACTAVVNAGKENVGEAVEAHLHLNCNDGGDFRESAEYKTESCVVLDAEEGTLFVVDVTDISGTQIFHVADNRGRCEWIKDEDYNHMFDHMTEYSDEVLGDMDSEFALYVSDCGEYIFINVDQLAQQ